MYVGDREHSSQPLTVLEAAPEFSRRGFATFRAEGDGSISLDQTVLKKQKAVRVRLIQDGTAIGTSRVPALTSGADPSVESSIRKARDSLFEEELFHEITRELRDLLPYGITMRDGVIVVTAQASSKSTDRTSPLANTEIVIDLLALEDGSGDRQPQPQDQLADWIALFLRMLLCHLHRKRLQARSQIPLPLGDRPRPNLQPHILRPLLSQIQHYDAVASVRSYLQQVDKTFKSAGLSVDLSLGGFSLLTDLSKGIKESTDPSLTNQPADVLMSVLSKPLETRITLFSTAQGANAAERPTEHSTDLTLVVRTNWSPPTSGTEYTLQIPQQMCSALLGPKAEAKQFSFSGFGDFCSYLNHVFAVNLTHEVIAGEHEGWLPVPRFADVFRTAKKTRGRKLSVQLEGNRLFLHCGWKDHLGWDRSYVWDGGPAEQDFRQAVSDVDGEDGNK